jgi:hypothetical protein
LWIGILFAGKFLVDDFAGMLNAILTDVPILSGDQNFYFIPATATERAVKICQRFCHVGSDYRGWIRMIGCKITKKPAVLLDEGQRISRKTPKKT